MPEAYTHIRVARAALRASGCEVRSTAAYELGAQGPDPFFAGPMPSVRGPYPMQTLGVRLHTEKCGVFLQALVHFARTPVQRSYALGFLTHAATDAVFHPYVAACTRTGGPFARPEGHGFCEAALDTFFHETDCGTPAVPADDAAPLLTGAPLAEVCALLRRALYAVYGEQVPAVQLSDMFHRFRLAHRLCCAPGAGRRALVRAADATVLRRLHRPGYALSHVTPAALPQGGFPHTWTNPFTGEKRRMGPNGLAMTAVERSVASLLAAREYWAGRADRRTVAQIFGNTDYNTGLPCGTKPAAAAETNEAGTEGKAEAAAAADKTAAAHEAGTARQSGTAQKTAPAVPADKTAAARKTEAEKVTAAGAAADKTAVVHETGTVREVETTKVTAPGAAVKRAAEAVSAGKTADAKLPGDAAGVPVTAAETAGAAAGEVQTARAMPAVTGEKSGAAGTSTCPETALAVQADTAAAVGPANSSGGGIAD